jgi:heat-inducible transcriptional repressor
MSELTLRQQTILSLIVREYVHSVMPVGSRTLVEKYDLDVSPATVRNEMASMEELGYLTHPHTSAGRVPTDLGYRYFVERLLQERELPLAERRTIAHQFQQVRENVEEWMPLAASVLVRTTRTAALVTAPRPPYARYRHIQLISTQGRMVLLILVLQGGLVRQQMLTLPEPMSQSTLNEASDRLNQMCTDLTADEIEKHVRHMPNFEADVARLAMRLMDQADTPMLEEVYHDGLSELLQEPEFSEGTHAHGVLRAIEESSLLETFLVETLSPNVGGVQVMIGEEGRIRELHACSLILSQYGVTGEVTGMLGVLGPKRMGYGRAISAVRFVSGLLSDLVYDVFVPRDRGLPPEEDSL